jgi:hypothetical protein
VHGGTVDMMRAHVGGDVAWHNIPFMPSAGRAAGRHGVPATRATEGLFVLHRGGNLLSNGSRIAELVLQPVEPCSGEDEPLKGVHGVMLNGTTSPTFSGRTWRLTVRIRTAMSGTNPRSPPPASRKPPSRTSDPHANGGPEDKSLILRRHTWLLNLCMAAQRA